METLDFILMAKRGLRSSTTTIKMKTNSSPEVVSINSLSLIIKNKLNKVIMSDDTFSDIIKVDVTCSDFHIEIEEDIKRIYTDYSTRDVLDGYSYYCNGFVVKLYFSDNNIKNKFKIKGNLSKLVTKLNNKFDTFYVS